MKITVSNTKMVIDLKSRGILFVLRATFFYKDGSQATSPHLAGPFVDRESAAHYAALYHHVRPGAQLLNDQWSEKINYPLKAGPSGKEMVDRVVVDVLEMKPLFAFYSHFEPKRLQNLQASS